MKHLTIILVFLFVSVISSPSSSGTVSVDDLVWRDGFFYKKFSNTLYTGDIDGKVSGYIRSGKRDGLWLEYHENGQLFIEKTYQNGKEHGLWLGYHDNGVLWGKGRIKDGLQYGLWEFYYTTGVPEKKGQYKNGKKTGVWEYFNENGTLNEARTY